MKLEDIRKLSQTVQYPITAQSQQEMLALLREMGCDPDNLYQELEMSSRLVDTHQDTSYSNNMIQLHSHAFYELLFCRNTCGAEYLVGSQRYRLQRGDIIMVPPGVSHRPLLPERMPEPYRRDVLWFTTELVDALAVLFPEDAHTDQSQHFLFRTAGTRWEFLGEVFRVGVRESEHRAPGWEAALVGNTMTLLVQLKRALMDRNAAPLQAEKPELLDRVMGYVEANLSKKLTLSDVAKRYYVSESTISHIFKEKMGASFYRCVTQRRLIAAKSLIQNGVPLEDVGRQVGFGDYSGFYRAFKQAYGISPRQFRKLQESSGRA